ncbi:hypothetical protein BWQ96_07001 [Gracilariopsis chorda]|uniref:SUI1 domain-containing protein n=1 Tax=Gracilariopsis chorda TaxID=448386 RepID=A0A2V3IMG5_9FLOR|nr:hypothetical protein BWQ96_07001 [Gracilariopsis chorda]|eukprot:PXF43274.1 hypothetical protein BWQ96_07001 [Gracilariopsis chorda]
MTAKILLHIGMLFVALGLVQGQTCKQRTPFKKELIGQTFAKLDDCYRPRSSDYVSVYKKMFILTLNENPSPACPERYLVVYRNPKVTPMIIKHPYLEFPLNGGASGSDVEEWCKKEQQKKKTVLFPVTETKKEFTAAVKAMLPRLKAIRDFGCTATKEGFIIQVQGRAYDNVDVADIMAYLHAVAFKYELCL